MSFKILVKLPTRSRPEKAIKIISEYKSLQTTNDVVYMVNVDADDHTMTPNVIDRIKGLGCAVYVGLSHSKIHAVNRDMDKAPDYDILVLASDDMHCQYKGWDALLQNEMRDNFPDTDGVLFHWDGDPSTKRHNNGKGLNTMCILGRKYYERFGYIYHSSYYSLWCDNEFTEVADKLDKQFRSDIILFRHIHFSNTSGLEPDQLMKKTQMYYSADHNTYINRKGRGFPR